MTTYLGTYGISISDNGNCVITDTFTVYEPNFPLQLSSYSGVINCNGTSDGTGYAQLLEVLHHIHTSGLMVVITPIGSGDSITGLSGGSYFVKVTDANGCDTVATLQVSLSNKPISW